MDIGSLLLDLFLLMKIFFILKRELTSLMTMHTCNKAEEHDFISTTNLVYHSLRNDAHVVGDEPDQSVK